MSSGARRIPPDSARHRTIALFVQAEQFEELTAPLLDLAGAKTMEQAGEAQILATDSVRSRAGLLEHDADHSTYGKLRVAHRQNPLPTPARRSVAPGSRACGWCWSCRHHSDRAARRTGHAGRAGQRRRRPAHRRNAFADLRPDGEVVLGHACVVHPASIVGEGSADASFPGAA